MLFDSIVYGPIHSRRLGVSLGMNLMPTTAKLCSFDCVYCECGFNQPVSHPQLPSREEVRLQLETKLKAMVDGASPLPNVITFPAMVNLRCIPISGELFRILVLCATGIALPPKCRC